MSAQPLAPRGGNDRVYTPDDLAQRIVDHFRPTGRVLEPCSGKGAFIRALDRPGRRVDWCEIDSGRDFLALNPEATGKRWPWIITNPPWGQFRAFLVHSMKLGENVVFLSLVNAWFMRARVEDMRRAGFGIVEILLLDTPPKPWPQTGFQLGAVRIQRGYSGLVKISRLSS